MLDHEENMPIHSFREQKQKDDSISISDIPTNFQISPFSFEQFKENQEFSYVSTASDYDNINDEEENSSCIASSIEQELNNSISDLRSVISSKYSPPQKQIKPFNLHSVFISDSDFESTKYSSEE